MNKYKFTFVTGYDKNGFVGWIKKVASVEEARQRLKAINKDIIEFDCHDKKGRRTL